MTQEDKELLIKELCARLPYGVKIQHGVNYRPMQLWNIGILELGTYNRAYYNNGLNNDFYSVEKIKPYLRPMSSMTEKEKEEYDKLFTIHSEGETYCENWEWIDFMNSHHFDYRGLIEKGLALPAPEGMYNLK